MCIMNTKQFCNIVEIRTKSISMVTFLCGSIYAYFATGLWSWKIGLLMALSVLFVDMGTTGFNTYFDFLNGTDRAKTNKEKDKVLVHEGIEPISALLVSLGLFMLSGVLGLFLAYYTSWKLLVVGFVCMVVGFTYTGGPFPISRTPFGEVFAGGFLGSVLFMLSYYVQTKSIDRQVFLVSMPFLFLVALILTINNTCDFASDKNSGRKTLSIVLGKKKSLWLPYLEFGIAFLLATILLVKGIYPLWVLPFLFIAFMLSLREMKMLYARGFSPETKSVSMASIAKLYVLFGLAFFFGHLVSLVTG
ncbi:1,4-dihydroxy-2-naphthoate octaprenyltransferase [Sphaerochaeta pleomorpha str. Grapes]|uniref:1,4-dihydroxy-2-naphthoate octaprenyltransferase n=2 Tax=Sphaerochaeta TaxID=399320 RepID=G8QU69_SPHPG|nr:1,4-dihydroxy-2-naphthoate octaprenyltransferase [Sphaerochaeta pleomorpha str. Grapes]